MSDKRPVVVYGANGFSGRLVVEFLREFNIPFVAAGRNRKRIQEVMLTLDKGEVPDDEYVIPLGVADVKRAGTDITIVATGWMVKKSLAAAEQLAKEGISAEVIDPRTLAPLDIDTVVRSIKKTGRLLLVDQAPRHSSAAAVIAGEIAEHV